MQLHLISDDNENKIISSIVLSQIQKDNWKWELMGLWNCNGNHFIRFRIIKNKMLVINQNIQSKLKQWEHS